MIKIIKNIELTLKKNKTKVLFSTIFALYPNKYKIVRKEIILIC